MDRSVDSGFLIDEEGNLFGLVNIVDAMAVLLVLAVVVAGAALVFGGQSGQQEEPLRYGTFSYTVPIDSSAASLEAGETLTPVRSGDTFTVESVIRSFNRGGQSHVTARMSYRGTATVNDNPIYGGESIRLTTGSYLVEADVVALDQKKEPLRTGSTSVVVMVNESVAETLTRGQTARIGGETVATVARVQQSVDGNRTQERSVALNLTTWNRNGVPWFGGHGIRVGTSITVVTDDAVISGQIIRVGTTDFA